eukprot:bmy_06985T0
MGQDAFMEPFSSTVGVFQCKIYLLLLAGACSGLKVAVPSHTVHGIRGQALYLPVHYGFHTPASDIQIIWLFERPHTMPKYLLGSVNKSVVPDLEYQHKFTMMPPNASLLINPLQFTDEGNYIVKVNIQGNGTVSCHETSGADSAFLWGCGVCGEHDPDMPRGRGHPAVTKEDIGNYSCLVKNPISEMESDIIMPTIY